MLSYVSTESGRAEVYLSDSAGRRTQASKGGGVEPVWSRDSKAVFFRNIEGTELFKVDVAGAGGLSLSAPRLVYRGKFTTTGRDPSYAAAPDGRLMLLVDTNTKLTSDISVTIDWRAELSATQRVSLR